MALLSDREAFDKCAMKRLNAAIASESAVLTVEDVCAIADYPMPTSEDDLRGFFRMCDTWGIKHNLLNEPIYRSVMEV